MFDSYSANFLRLSCYVQRHFDAKLDFAHQFSQVLPAADARAVPDAGPGGRAAGAAGGQAAGDGALAQRRRRQEEGPAALEGHTLPAAAKVSYLVCGKLRFSRNVTPISCKVSRN